MKRWIMFLAAFLMMAPGARADKNPIEIGAVRWGRDLDGALQKSGETGRPVLVLFQEVPGCSGCQNFGQTVLTHPLVVEAVEDEFLPVLVYNNRVGRDRELLERFGEPAWNFQVVRFLDAAGRDIIPRKDRVWTAGHLARRMIEALQAAKRPVPKYLQALSEETGFETYGRQRPAENQQAIYQVPGLTDIQRERIEELLAKDRAAALEWLSPRQRKVLEETK